MRVSTLLEHRLLAIFAILVGAIAAKFGYAAYRAYEKGGRVDERPIIVVVFDPFNFYNAEVVRLWGFGIIVCGVVSLFV